MLRNLYLSARYLGVSWLLFRVAYALQQKSGLLEKRMPIRKWSNETLRVHLRPGIPHDPQEYGHYRKENSPPFFFCSQDLPDWGDLTGEWDSAGTITKNADDIGAGYFPHFSRSTIPRGFPPQWNANPHSGEVIPASVHWSRIDDYPFGDIKWIWEVNRFAFVYVLVRAYARTCDERYAETFWQLVEDWQLSNTPNAGVNWKCGQEITFRVMAWLFGLYAFQSSKTTTMERLAEMARMIAVSGHRIEGNIQYALHQKNNHGISEAVGLWTIGLLFPELSEAQRWRAKGKKYLEQQGSELLYDDGSFSQHSANYHRLMLHDYLWAFRLGDVHGERFSEGLRERVRKGNNFLYELLDSCTGQVPCYGQNDGALILPFDNCDYSDFRPVVQAMNYYFTGERLIAPGPWDEGLLWLFGPQALTAPLRERSKANLMAPDGGYYTLRSKSGFAFVRCPNAFRHRPGQADMLHLDLWWKGQNIATDPGTYSYNAPEPWDNALAHTAYHNTVTVDDRDQMDKMGRFLWYPWVNGEVRCVRRSDTGALGYWEGTHNGYRRLSVPVDYRRALVMLGDDSWLVIDALDSSAHHTYRVNWLFPDVPHEWDGSGQLALHTNAGLFHVTTESESTNAKYSLVRADASSPRGWRSPYYQHKEPALSLGIRADTNETCFRTVLSPHKCRLTLTDQQTMVESADWQALIDMATPRSPGTPLVARIVVMSGSEADHLEMF